MAFSFLLLLATATAHAELVTPAGSENIDAYDRILGGRMTVETGPPRKQGQSREAVLEIARHETDSEELERARKVEPPSAPVDSAEVFQRRRLKARRRAEADITRRDTGRMLRDAMHDEFSGTGKSQHGN